MTLLLDYPIDLQDERWELPGLDPDFEGYSDIMAVREAEFKAMGWADYLAKHLATCDIDMGKMKSMLKNGCPPDLCLDIFFGGRVLS